MKKLIYFDNNSSTPVDPRVFKEMVSFFTHNYANASSSHNYGLLTRSAVENARKQVADLINVDKEDILFTSGATESINLAIKGLALSSKNIGKHIITVETEHKAVLDTCQYLESLGFEITYLPVDKYGFIDWDEFHKAFRPDTFLVSIMFVNNEIGVIQPIKELARITHEKGALFMTDATQAVGKMQIDNDDLKVDLLTFSAHKIYGPKGIGALYLKDSSYLVSNIAPLIHGGGHEKGLRSGTLNTPGIIGFGKSCAIAKQDMFEDEIRIKTLRDTLEFELLKIKGAFVNGSVNKRLYNVTNICFPNIDANVLIGKMNNIAVSNGSACTSSLIEPSHVLKAISLSNELASGSIRFSLGRFNNKAEVDYAINKVRAAINDMMT